MNATEKADVQRRVRPPLGGCTASGDGVRRRALAVDGSADVIACRSGGRRAQQGARRERCDAVESDERENGPSESSAASERQRAVASASNAYRAARARRASGRPRRVRPPPARRRPGAPGRRSAARRRRRALRVSSYTATRAPGRPNHVPSAVERVAGEDPRRRGDSNGEAHEDHVTGSPPPFDCGGLIQRRRSAGKVRRSRQVATVTHAWMTVRHG